MPALIRKLNWATALVLQGSYFPFTNGDSTWWSPSKGIRDINDLESYTVPPGTITYVLSVLTDAGCLIQDSLLIRVTVDRTVFTPNVMIANGNGAPIISSMFMEKRQ